MQSKATMQPVSDAFRGFIARQEPELAQGLADALENTPPSVSVRLNGRKLRGGMPPLLCGGSFGMVPWWDGGFYLPSRPDFTHDPSLHQGLYYVQDASSMVVAHVVRALVSGPVRYLDACAAPGGKTTAAVDALPDGSLVVANEFDFRRAEILKENVTKWGYPGVVVTRGDTCRFRSMPGWFDVIAADVPCSGEGMMRKDETARTQWSEALVRECAARQMEIVGNLWGALRPGGCFIYSTCTFNRCENEEVVEKLVEATGATLVEIPLPAGSGAIVVRDGMMRFLPSRVRGEGLFMAVLRKREDDIPAMPRGDRLPGGERRGKKAKRTERTGKGSAVRPDGGLADAIKRCIGWVGDGFELAVRGEEVCAFPAGHIGGLRELEENLDVIYCGVTAGCLKGRAVIPGQSLAMSLALRDGAFVTREVDRAAALAYLRRESMPGFDVPRGHLLLTHGEHPLGFVNNLGNRSNNLYPAPWRILR